MRSVACRSTAHRLFDGSHDLAFDQRTRPAPTTMPPGPAATSLYCSSPEIEYLAPVGPPYFARPFHPPSPVRSSDDTPRAVPVPRQIQACESLCAHLQFRCLHDALAYRPPALASIRSHRRGPTMPSIPHHAQKICPSLITRNLCRSHAINCRRERHPPVQCSRPAAPLSLGRCGSSAH